MTSPQESHSRSSRRQRELAWMLYIVEGAIANMDKAIAVNCVTFDDKDHLAVCRAQDKLVAATDPPSQAAREHLTCCAYFSYLFLCSCFWRAQPRHS